MQSLFAVIKNSIKYWWVVLLSGILYVVLAFLLMFSPIASYITLSILFSVFMFVTGLFEIIFAVSNRKQIQNWGWNLVTGIIDFVIGIILVSNPGLGMAVIPILIAFWLMFHGLQTISFSIDFKQFGSKQWGWYLVLGILTILFSVLIIWQPGVGALSLVYLLSFTLLSVGIFKIISSLDFRHLNKELKKAELNQ